MANNFKFLSSCVRDRIRLKLYGDFDGSSACELINFLKNYRNGSNQIFINTNNLNTIHPFGVDVFIKNLSALGININNIIIAGKNRFSLEKRWCWLAFKTIRDSKYIFWRCQLNDKERFALAERIRKRIQGNNSNFRLIKRRDEIEKELNEKIENNRYRTFNEKE